MERTHLLGILSTLQKYGTREGFHCRGIFQQMDKISKNTILPKEPMTLLVGKQSGVRRLATLRSWLLYWEIYLIAFIAAFLRFYQPYATEFDNDQANLFQMARYAATHGLIPATANISSTSIYIPPAAIDILMLPAAFTNNPVWGAIMTAILATISVFLTYYFVCQYYGRVAATIAALIYATLFEAVERARTIWNPNLLPLFVVLFMMALFRGTVARRKGWLFPALFLLGIIIQLHATGVMLTIPLAIALVLAPATIRWRDLVKGSLALLIIYFPYLLWETAVRFHDLNILIQASFRPGQKVVFNNLSWLFYQAVLNPYDPRRSTGPFFYNTSLFWQLSPYLAWISQMLIYLVIASGITLFILAVWPWKPSGTNSKSNAEASTDGNQSRNTLRPWKHVRHYWSVLRASPYRCGLILLLAWQFIPVIILFRHSNTIPLMSYYFIFVIPGPCILIGIFLAKTADANTWLLTKGNKLGGRDPSAPYTTDRESPSVGVPGYYQSLAPIMRYSIYTLASLIIIAQFIGTTAAILDTDHGNYSDGRQQAFAYNDLRSLYNALHEADQLAQRHHLNRVYISVSAAAHTQSSLRFLSTQIHTPTTVFDSSCVLLPAPAEEPAVMLVSPYTNLTNALVTQFATATLIDQPRRPGGAPFKLYIVTPKPVQAVPHAQLSGNLPLDTFSQPFSFNHIPWIVTHWSLPHSAPSADNRTYTYSITVVPVSKSSRSRGTTEKCIFTAMRAGDQLLLPFNQHNLFPSSQSSASPAFTVKGQFYEADPLYLHFSFFNFLTFAHIFPQNRILSTPENKLPPTTDTPIPLQSIPNTPGNTKLPA